MQPFTYISYRTLCIELLTLLLTLCIEQIPWSVYQKQFEAIFIANGWDNVKKAKALIIVLKRQALEL